MKLIERFLPGDSRRTAFSAEVMNEFVAALNMVLRAHPGKGLKVYFADGGLRIELDEFVLRQLLMTGDGEGGSGNGEQAEGTLKWRGEWDSSKQYKANDIVIHRTTTAIDEGLRAGTYLAVADNTGVEPSEDTAANQTTWRTLAKGSWSELNIAWSGYANGKVALVVDSLGPQITVSDTKTAYLRHNEAFVETSICGDSDASSGSTGLVSRDAIIMKDNLGSNVRMLVLHDDIPSGRQVKAREITYFDGVGTQTRVFLCTEQL